MPTIPNRGYGRIPYGRGLYGRAMTVEGDADATVTPLDLDLEAQQLGGSAGVSAAIVPAEVVVTGADVRGLVPAGTLTFRTKVEHG